MAARTLVAVVYAGRDPAYRSKEKYLNLLKKLAYERKDSWGMVMLGIVFGGGEHRNWIEAESFSATDFAEFNNESEGLRLIEEGVKLDKSDDVDMKLNWEDILAIGGIYYNRFKRGKESGTANLDDQRKAVEYWEKSLALIPPDEKEIILLIEKMIGSTKDEVFYHEKA